MQQERIEASRAEYLLCITSSISVYYQREDFQFAIKGIIKYFQRGGFSHSVS